ncbi:MAG: hypothetical protein IKO06_04645, partial [Alphaproteobacteria bacterium]|nr:hypothetical protein [Alphaproteobacteria bacterium]
LAIIGVLSVGGIAGYSKAMTKYRINKTIEQITLIAGNVRAFWGPQKNYIGVYCSCYDGSCNGQSDGDGCPIVKKAKIFPDDMITVTDSKIMSITNPFGGDVSLNSYNDEHTVSKNGKGAFEISFFSIPEEACIEILSHDWSVSSATYVCTVAPYPHCTATPADLEKVMTICTKEAYKNRIIIEFDGYYNFETEFID